MDKSSTLIFSLALVLLFKNVTVGIFNLVLVKSIRPFQVND